MRSAGRSSLLRSGDACVSLPSFSSKKPPRPASKSLISAAVLGSSQGTGFLPISRSPTGLPMLGLIKPLDATRVCCSPCSTVTLARKLFFEGGIRLQNISRKLFRTPLLYGLARLS
ncbi:Os08g0535501 [Oryza sativa Japonica Group]|uniref:Os08g0535501 protein n=1 Tax=Oryza sativa subsp. japonica TaxID=39947 RepID=A0A0P0XIQ0_ORYSJ|nr:hypothetical protein EE612_045601 [Oryza sativa]BAT06437.1 Os08g0535501 [Oryza sativa Japonica Group]